MAVGELDPTLLDNIKSNQPVSDLSVDSFDVSSELTPEELALYKETRTPVTGGLSAIDYYPDLNNPVAVGNYSGSKVGSLTLFAPGGALAPLGMIDAREAAIQRAAMNKVKEIDEFNKMYKAPSSKLVNINPELTKQYYEGLSAYRKSALRKTNGDQVLANKLLDKDQNFQQWNKSMQDLAKYGDDIVATKAMFDEEIKTGNFLPSPSFMATEKKLLSAINPSSPDFKKVGDYYRQYKLDRDFSDVYNDAVKGMVANQMGFASYDESNPELVASYEKTIENLTPEQKEGIKSRIRAVYHGSDYFTEDYINKNVDNYTNWQRVKKDISVTQKREGYGDTDYKEAIPETNKAFNFSKVDESGNETTESVHSEFGYNTKAKDQSKELTFVLSDKTRDLSGNKLSDESGNVKGQVQFVGVMPYDVAKKRYYTTEEVKNLKEKGLYYNNHNIRFEPGAIVNTISSAEEKGDGGRNQVSVVVPISDIKGKLSKGFDEKINEVESRAKNVKKENASAPKEQKKEPVKKNKDPLGLF